MPSKKKQKTQTVRVKAVIEQRSPHPIYTELVDTTGVNPREHWTPRPLPSQQMGEK